MKRFDAIAIGSATVDVIIRSDELKRIEEIADHKEIPFLCLRYASKIEMDHLEFDPGGSGHNIAVGLARFGNKSAVITKLGKDRNGDLVISSLKENGVDTRLVSRTKKAMTGFSIILVEPKGERSIIVYRGANNFLNKDDIKRNYVKNSRMLIFTSVLKGRSIEAVKKAVRIGKTNDSLIVANPSISMMKNNKEETIKLIERSDVLIVNEEEASFLTGKVDLRRNLKELKELGPNIVVITLGKKGSIAYSDKIYKQAAFKVKPVDTTGAGDTFSAGFLHYLLKDKGLKECLKFASATAAINVTTYGAIKDFPSERNVLKFMKSQGG